MEIFTDLVDHLAVPPVLFGLTVLLMAALRWRSPWTRAGGLTALVLTAAFLALGLIDGGFRRLVLDPERFPVLVLVVLSAFVLWRVRYLAGRRERRERPVPGASWPGLAAPELVAGMVVILLVAVAAFVWGAPLVAPADPAQPPNPAKAPWFLVGLQEMRLAFDGWFAGLLLPVLVLAALVALPFLDPGGSESEEEDREGPPRALATSFLAGWWLLWLLPMAIGVFLRGPHWQLFGPFAPWDGARPPAAAAEPLAALIWDRLLAVGPPEHWLVRELPGIVLVGCYFAVPPLVLPRWRVTRGLVGRSRQRLGRVRFAAVTVLGLALLSVPLKMGARWLCGLDFLIHLPELSFNF